MMKSIRLLMQFLFLLYLLIESREAKALPSIDTLENYLQLKLYNQDADTIFVNHERYYGLFVRDTCNTEDYGTVITSVSACWKRQHNNFHPRFWEIGGQSPDFLIGGVKKEIDAINSAAIAAYNSGGDTIEIDFMYEIDRSVFLLSNNTYLGTSDSAGFRRIDPPKTFLTDTARIGDSKIAVESNEGFRSYQKINIATNVAYDSIAGYASYTAGVSASFGGDTTIWLSGLHMQKQMLPGDSVSLFYSMMSPRFTSTDSIHIKNLILDGNRQQYDLNYDWRVNATILLPTMNEGTIENCRFYNISNENIFLCGMVMKNCSGIGFNGSAIHFSCNALDHSTEILYNHFSNLNEIGDSLMEHSEAGFTFSAKVQNFRIAYNTLTSIKENDIGIFGNDDSMNEITDNLLDSELETIEISPFYLYPETNLIYNNKNLNFTDLSEDSCLLSQPKLVDILPCQRNSLLKKPLSLSDTIEIIVDSLLVRNSNENFLKCIIPIFDNEFFSLSNVELETPGISQYHQWNFDNTSSICQGAVFDNGHKNGTFGQGNWGYSLCNQVGGCTNVKISFVLTNLPDTITEMSCPLLGLQLKYDGEVDNWDSPLYCQNETIIFDTLLLGNPIVNEDPITTINESNSFGRIDIYPNPCREILYFKNPVTPNSKYKILNFTGYITQSGRIFENNLLIGDLPLGIYIIELEDNGKKYYSRFGKI